MEKKLNTSKSKIQNKLTEAQTLHKKDDIYAETWTDKDKNKVSKHTIIVYTLHNILYWYLNNNCISMKTLFSIRLAKLSNIKFD